MFPESYISFGSIANKFLKSYQIFAAIIDKKKIKSSRDTLNHCSLLRHGLCGDFACLPILLISFGFPTSQNQEAIEANLQVFDSEDS